MAGLIIGGNKGKMHKLKNEGKTQLFYARILKWVNLYQELVKDVCKMDYG